MMAVLRSNVRWPEPSHSRPRPPRNRRHFGSRKNICMASALISCSIRRLQAGACLKNKILGKSVSSNQHWLIDANAASSLARQLAKKFRQRKLQFQECMTHKPMSTPRSSTLTSVNRSRDLLSTPAAGTRLIIYKRWTAIVSAVPLKQPETEAKGLRIFCLVA